MKKKLADSTLFSGLDNDGLKQLEEIAREVKIDKGAILFFQQDEADRFFIVLEGKIKIYKTSPEGKEQILLLAGPGDSFGEAALFAGFRYPASAAALEDTTLAGFSREKFIGLLKNNPDLAVNMIGRLSMLLHHLTRLIQGLSLEDVATRLARYIHENIPPDKPADPVKIELAEKKNVLASLFGTIPETLSRAFASLSDYGIISVEKRHIIVHDRKRLAKIAEGEKT